jgi:hypothetical protein
MPLTATRIAHLSVPLRESFARLQEQRGSGSRSAPFTSRKTTGWLSNVQCERAVISMPLV